MRCEAAFIPRGLRCSSDAVCHVHTISFHLLVDNSCVRAQGALTLSDTIIAEMIPEICGPKVPFVNSVLGPKVLFLSLRVPGGVMRSGIRVPAARKQPPPPVMHNGGCPMSRPVAGHLLACPYSFPPHLHRQHLPITYGGGSPRPASGGRADSPVEIASRGLLPGDARLRRKSWRRPHPSGWTSRRTRAPNSRPTTSRRRTWW